MVACPAISSTADINIQPAPGIKTIPTTLSKRLIKAFRGKGKKYLPRTHHLQKDGSPKYINRLIFETSPYLLQHAHNPVNWRAWGDEAFEVAILEDKPVLLSIGYSTCHWCHVMERESFEDEEIATYINQNFIAIKVDREERPDIDDIYMSVVQTLTGRGGWPMTTVLTPEREAFFGGTYFPARDGDRGSRKGFFTILKELKTQYVQNKQEAVSKAKQITQRLQAAARPVPPTSMPQTNILMRSAQNLAQRFERQYGGFSQQPKFPRPVNLEFLLRYYRRTQDPQAKHMLQHTLNHMYWGGMYDHVGGGFHRYSTDKKWLVPHFEKMLYDNGQLAEVYIQAFQAFQEPRYAFVAQDILNYIQNEMASPQGPFYSATDADSPSPHGHDEEGLFFTWTPEETTQILGTQRARIFNKTFNVSKRGNFEGRNILHLKKPMTQIAPSFKMTTEVFNKEIEGMKKALYQNRTKRAPPIRDDKFIVSWNGLMVGALAKAGFVFDRDDYIKSASNAADFILQNMTTQEGRLYRTHFKGKNRYTAYLDDYAFLIHGLLNLLEATGETKWLLASQKLNAHLQTFYWDQQYGGYFMTASDSEKLLTRDKPIYDGAEPCGNSVAAMNLLRLHTITTEEHYKKTAEKLFSAFGSQLQRSGVSIPKMLSALEYYYDKPKEIVLVTPKGMPLTPLREKLQTIYLPNRMLAQGTTKQLKALKQQIPWIENKTPINRQPTAYVCEAGLCEKPTNDPNVFVKQIMQPHPLIAPHLLKNLNLGPPKASPRPWEYNPNTNQHWHAGHGHWHDGPPPQRK